MSDPISKNLSTTTVLVFGNPDFEPDSLPVRLLQQLRQARPDLKISHLDPNEDWELSGDLTVIDTVINLTEPRIFDSLEDFEPPPRYSAHDFDAHMELRLARKLGKIDRIKIIGLPPTLDEPNALKFILLNLK